MSEFRGKSVLITGGAGGIGLGIAQAFLEVGARVAVADREDGLQTLSDAVGERLVMLPLDVASLESWSNVRERVEDAFGPLDVLCNNAGVSQTRGPIVDRDPDEFDRLIAVNLKGVFNGVITFGRGMVDRRRGYIVNTSSMTGLASFAGLGIYGATKFGVVGLTEALHQEMAPHGVVVGLLCPGLVRSRMTMAGASRGEVLESNMMEPIWVGRAVIDGLIARELYIITHPHQKEYIQRRHDQLLASFGDPAQPGYEFSAGKV